MPFAKSALFLHPQPVRIALGRIFEMDPYVRERWRRSRYRSYGGLAGGVVLASIGVLLLLQNLNIPGFDDLEKYWPAILIVVGIAQAARSLGMGGGIWGGAVHGDGRQDLGRRGLPGRRFFPARELWNHPSRRVAICMAGNSDPDRSGHAGAGDRPAQLRRDWRGGRCRGCEKDGRGHPEPDFFGSWREPIVEFGGPHE